ncbi:hypothetical protein DICPUDRAFT_52580 [Dictyostelium purpureum]|uniref:STAS domain-containing protein n=1 Tax=Dictyostelium purpureum TaxID=5786 RepID=F0Z8Z4_DICPU|nr:uncharacterized protein DICPUDRAFT_52580 [Dictyostelium purpureum]EGC39570.1 hypothetical protein DICPUDRAFT_52580 [Dictyostelium purpureum]|eukprot:XP_003283905.1 hypothetical protein DICPUDRAFT_52580 [Dictyostelium purpureum]
MGDHLKNTREWIIHSANKGEEVEVEKTHFFAGTNDEDQEQFLFTKEELTNPKELAKAMKVKIPLYVPIINWIKSYSKDDLVGDVLSAITVATMLVPQGLAYGVLATLPAIYGLYSGWLPLVIYSFMGSCKQLAVGPEALLSVLLGSILNGMSEDQVGTDAGRISVAHTLALLVGIVSFLFGVCQFGFLGGILSRWVLSGFINAVALIIAISQLDALLGVVPGSHSGHHPGPYQKFWDTITNLNDADKATVIMSAGCCAFLVGMRFFKQLLIKKFGWKNAKYIPEILLTVIITILVTWLFGLQKDVDKATGQQIGSGIKILLDVDGGFPTPDFPSFKTSIVQELLPQAFLIVIVGFVEATAVSKGLATKHNYQISSNRELVAFGTANILGSIFGSYPVFASIPRTSIQDMAGSRTCLSGFITSCLLLVTCVFLTSLFKYLPYCAMASIIFVAAFGLIEVHEAKFLWKTRSWGDLIQFTIALLSTFILEVELGILISVGMCIFLVLKHSASPHVYSVLGRVPGTNRFKDVAKFPEAEPIEGILLIRIDEVLYFANIGQFKQLLSEIERMMDKSSSVTGSGSTPLQSIIINVVNIPEMDASALLTIEEMVEAYHKRSVKVAFVQVSEKIKDSFKKSGLYDIVTPQYLFDSNYEAVTFLEQNINQSLHSSRQVNLNMPINSEFNGDDDDSISPSQKPLRNQQFINEYNDEDVGGGGAILNDNLKLEDDSDPDSDDFISK